MVLENYVKDFKNLINWLKLKVGFLYHNCPKVISFDLECVHLLMFLFINRRSTRIPRYPGGPPPWPGISGKPRQPASFPQQVSRTS